ncbi:kinase subunit of RNA polymerase II carboxy-terminal domain kinase I, partial [Tulasnella sp. 427]
NTAPEHDERSANSQSVLSYGQSTPQGRSYNWRADDDRVEVVKSMDARSDSREWTRRRDDEREWTRDSRHETRPPRDNWDSRPNYSAEPSSAPSKPMPKFAPGPNWKGDDNPTAGRSGKGSWKGKGQYERKKKEKDQSRDRIPKSNDNDFRGRDNDHQLDLRSFGNVSGLRQDHQVLAHSPDPHLFLMRGSQLLNGGGGQARVLIEPHILTDRPERREPETGLHHQDPPNPRMIEVVRRSAAPRAIRAVAGHGRAVSQLVLHGKGFAEKLKTRLLLRQRPGVNGASSAKHRLPPSGPRAADLMNAKFQPVHSSFTGNSSSSANVAAAYGRRNMTLGEPPPGPRAETRSGPKPSGSVPLVPTGPKGMYPPPQPLNPAVTTAKPGDVTAGGKTASTGRAGFRPIGNYGKSQSNSAIKRFFPSEDETPEEKTPADDQETRGGGEGFGIIPSRKASRQHSPAIWPRPTSHTTSPTAGRSTSTKSPDVPKGPKYLRERDISSPAQDYQRSGLTPPSEYTSRRASGRQDLTDEDRPRGNETLAVKDVTSVPVQPPAELYQLVNQVGEGTFGKVYKAKNVMNGRLVALKRIKVEAEKDGFPVTALREIKLLQSLSHPNIILLHEMMVSKGNVFMVFDYMEHDLTGILSQSQFVFEPAHLKSLCHQMLHGLAYLHQKGVVHRDMKGSNILVNSRGELKLADFGLARIFQKRRKNDYTNRVITLWYRPPELLLGTTVYGPEVDMWSAGTIMLELFTKKPVFQGNDEIHQLEVIYRILGTATTDGWPGLADMPWYELVKPKEIFKNHFRTVFQKYLSPAALDLAEGLLTYDPEKRLTAADALEAPYFVSEEPPMAQPVGLAKVEGEWHELETKREREKRRRGKRDELPSMANGHDASNGIDQEL